MHLFQGNPLGMMNGCLTAISLQPGNDLTSSQAGKKPLLERRNISIQGVSLPPHGLQSRGIKGIKEFSKEGAEGKLRKIVKALLCSAQPWKDSLLSPRAPRGASLVPKGLCLAAGQAVPPREGGVSKVTPRVLCHGRPTAGPHPSPWHNMVIVVCSELLLQPWEDTAPAHGTDSPWGKSKPRPHWCTADTWGDTSIQQR